jgi:hypothetical protein
MASVSPLHQAGLSPGRTVGPLRTAVSARGADVTRPGCVGPDSFGCSVQSGALPGSGFREGASVPRAWLAQLPQGTDREVVPWDAL